MQQYREWIEYTKKASSSYYSLFVNILCCRSFLSKKMLSMMFSFLFQSLLISCLWSVENMQLTDYRKRNSCNEFPLFFLCWYHELKKSNQWKHQAFPKTILSFIRPDDHFCLKWKKFKHCKNQRSIFRFYSIIFFTVHSQRNTLTLNPCNWWLIASFLYF